MPNTSEQSNIRHIRSNASETLEARFDRLSTLVHDLGEQLKAEREFRGEPMSESKRSRVELTKKLLEDRGTLLISDVRQELNVGLSTATRIVHAVSHSGAGYLMFEPAGARERLRLWHPSKVALDAPNS